MPGITYQNLADMTTNRAGGKTMLLYRDYYKAKRVWKWLIKPSDGPANFKGIELDIVQFPDNRLDCWVDGKHYPEIIDGLTLPITKEKIVALAGDDNAIVEIRG